MNKRKWICSGVPVTSLASLVDCIDTYGVVYCGFMHKVMNSSWVLSQQMRVLLRLVRGHGFYYPKPNTEGVRK